MVKSLLESILKGAWNSWDNFWFRQTDYAQVALLRICFSLIMFTYYLSRIPDLNLFFTNQGLLPVEYFPNHEYFRHHFSILFYVDNLFLIHALHAVFLLSLLFMCFGAFTRYASIVAWFLHLMFVARNPAIQYGADLVASFYFLYFCFAKSNTRFTFCKPSIVPKENSTAAILHSMALSLMRVQLCVIYFYAGTSKLKGARWWNGSAIWDVFTMEGLVRWDLSFIAYFPHILVAACYTTLLWEIYFPALIWTKACRKPLIVFGVLMHIGFGIFINIPNFGLLIVSLYIVFLKEDEVDWIVSQLRECKNKVISKMFQRKDSIA